MKNENRYKWISGEKHRKVNKNLRIKLVSCAAIVALTALAGCSKVEENGERGGDVSSILSGVPMPTATPEQISSNQGTDVPVDVPVDIPVSGEEESGTSASATPAPADIFDADLPALKADGLGWGLFHFGSGIQPRGNEQVDVLEKYQAYYMGNPEDKVLYLTFDCGYENGNTDAILTALKAHDVKATFFVTGHFVETEAELLKRMVENGHTVGNHSYNHPDITQLDEETFRTELDSVRDKFKEVTGAELSMYFRPPQGICYSQALKWSVEMGYATIFWSTAYKDWDTEAQPTHEEAMQTITGRTHPGAVVLLHNTSKTNGEILDELLTKWEEMGYVVKPLSELVGM